MRNKKTIIILGVILAIMVGLYIFASLKKPSEIKKSEENQPVSIFDVQKDQITEVIITNKEGKVVIVRKENVFVLTEPSGFKYDKSRVDGLVNNIANLAIEKVIDENATDTNKFGFATPVQILVKYDGKIKEFEMGSQNSTKDAYYFREKNSNKIYTIASYIGQLFGASKTDLRDKQVFDLVPDEVINFTMYKGDNLFFSSKKGEDKNWNLTAPIEVSADATKIMPIIDGLSKNSSFYDYIEHDAQDLEKYGLKKPSYSFEYQTAKGKTKIMLGNKKDSTTQVYMKTAFSNEIFTIETDNLKFLDKPLKEIIDPFAYLVSIQDVSKIVVEMDGKSVVSEMSTNKDDKTKDKFIVNGKEANMKDESDSSLFRKYYQSLIGVTIEDVDLTGKPEGKADITFTFSLKKAPGIMKVEFISKDQSYYYVVRNGNFTNLIVSKKTFDAKDGVRDTQKKILEAISK